MATKKHFATAKENQTAPILNNASIYRAGRNPNLNKDKLQIDSDNEKEKMVTNSYYLPEKLPSNAQPTFVDALKHRIDSHGRRITRSQIINTKPKPISTTSNHNNSDSHTPSSPIRHTQTKPNTNHNTVSHKKIQSYDNSNNKIKAESIDESDNDSSDDSSSDDFDMNNLDTLTVPKVENDIDVTIVDNEADDIRKKFNQKRLELEKQQESEHAPVIVPTDKMNIDASDSDSEDDSEDDSDVSSESEYETATSSDDDEQKNNLHPRKRKIQFMNKQRRDDHFATVNKPSLDEEALVMEQLEIERHDKLKQQTQEDVLNYIREQERLEREGDESDEELPDDNDDDIDGVEGQKEFEAWKLREIKRNLRDETAKKQREKEKRELERRRQMTDDEIMRENERLGLNKEKKKGNMKFMQKYYHQGVFYRDGTIVEENVLDRNFNAPTGQDKYINFEKVPEAMRTKNFGKMSQSKWTHLANEDTTFDKQDREWFKKKDGLVEEEKEQMKKERYMFRHKAHQNNFWFQRAGTGTIDRPSYKKGNINNLNNKRFEKKDKDKNRDRNVRKGRGRHRHRRDK